LVARQSLSHNCACCLPCCACGFRPGLHQHLLLRLLLLHLLALLSKLLDRISGAHNFAGTPSASPTTLLASSLSMLSSTSGYACASCMMFWP
jgi:hypothetical protein